MGGTICARVIQHRQKETQYSSPGTAYLDIISSLCIDSAMPVMATPVATADNPAVTADDTTEAVSYTE